MEAFSTIRDWLGRRAEELLALILASLFITFLIQIVFRYFLNLPLGLDDRVRLDRMAVGNPVRLCLRHA